MDEKTQREIEFKKEFNTLLMSYGAELELVDVGTVCDGWHHAQAVQVTMKRDGLNEFCEFLLAL